MKGPLHLTTAKKEMREKFAGKRIYKDMLWNILQ